MYVPVPRLCNKYTRTERACLCSSGYALKCIVPRLFEIYTRCEWACLHSSGYVLEYTVNRYVRNIHVVNGRRYTLLGTHWNALHHCFQLVPGIFTLAYPATIRLRPDTENPFPVHPYPILYSGLPRYLDRLSHFCRVHHRDRPNDWQDHATSSVTICRIHARRTAMRPKTSFNQRIGLHWIGYRNCLHYRLVYPHSPPQIPFLSKPNDRIAKLTSVV